MRPEIGQRGANWMPEEEQAEKCKCKGSEAAVDLVCLRNIQEPHVARTEWIEVARMMGARKYKGLGVLDHVGLCWTIVRALVLTLSGWRVRVTARFCTEQWHEMVSCFKEFLWLLGCLQAKGIRQQWDQGEGHGNNLGGERRPRLDGSSGGGEKRLKFGFVLKEEPIGFADR